MANALAIYLYARPSVKCTTKSILSIPVSGYVRVTRLLATERSSRTIEALASAAPGDLLLAAAAGLLGPRPVGPAAQWPAEARGRPVRIGPAQPDHPAGLGTWHGPRTGTIERGLGTIPGRPPPFLFFSLFCLFLLTSLFDSLSRWSY
jgi:hypothetical protein